MRAVWGRVAVVRAAVGLIFGIVVAPVRADGPPSIVPYVGTLPLGYFSATATISVAPGQLALTMRNIIAEDSPLADGAQGAGVVPIVTDRVDISEMNFVAFGCTSGSPTDPACAPSVNRNFYTSGSVPATYMLTPGGTHPTNCGLPLYGGVFTGTGTWSLGFPCDYLGGMSPDTRCTWNASVVAYPLVVANVREQTYSLVGTATANCFGSPLPVPLP